MKDIPVKIEREKIKKWFNVFYTLEDGEQTKYIGTFSTKEEALKKLEEVKKYYNFSEDNWYFLHIIIEKWHLKIKNILYV